MDDDIDVFYYDKFDEDNISSDEKYIPNNLF